VIPSRDKVRELGEAVDERAPVADSWMARLLKNSLGMGRRGSTQPGREDVLVMINKEK